MVKLLAPHLWAKDNPGLRRRVVGSLGLLLAGKALNVQVPFLFKDAVDSLNAVAPMAGDISLWTAGGTVLLGCTALWLSFCMLTR